MNKKQTLALLQAVQQGAVQPQQALEELQQAPFDNLGYAMVDNHRALRQGVPEVIYGRSKTGAQIAGIVEKMLQNGEADILVTGMDAQAAAMVEKLAPLEYHAIARLGIVKPVAQRAAVGNIVLASAGTSDMPVCEEAALTAEVLGNRVTRLYDVGVAGLHRLLAHLDVLAGARVVIAVAGMEGALPSVIGGLVSCPVIAVPTSVGYGANLQGLSALLSMLNSCASGVSVVNIDNGFGAGFLASRINQMEGLQ